MNIAPVEKTVETKSLIASQFNPPSRVEGKDFDDLCENIREMGILERISLGDDGRVADGHRRLAAAVRLEIKTVRVAQYEIETPILWVILNGHKKSLGARDFSYAYVNGLGEKALDAMPTYGAIKNIRRIQEIGGDELLIKIAEAGISPTIHRYGTQIAGYCGCGQDLDFILKTMNWLIDLKMQAIMRACLATNYDPSAIRRAIEENRPITFSVK